MRKEQGSCGVADPPLSQSGGPIRDNLTVETRGGAFIAAGGKIRRLVEVSVDIDLLSLESDLLTGEDRFRSGIEASAKFLGFGFEFSAFRRDVPVDAFGPGSLIFDVFDFPARPLDLRPVRPGLEGSKVFPVRGSGAKVGAGIGGSVGFDELGFLRDVLFRREELIGN